MKSLPVRPARAPGRFAFAVMGACAGLLMSAASGEAANNQGLDTVELKIINTSGHGGDLYMYAFGDAKGTTWYVSDTDGNVTAFPATTGFVPYGIKLSGKKRQSVQIPQLSAARVYFSLGKSMQVTVPAAGKPQTPTGWTKSEPNYGTLFDWFEYTWADVAQPSSFQTSFNGNLTQVDMVGLPMLLRLNGQDATQQQVFTAAGFSKGRAREQLMALMKKSPKPWKKLVVNPKRKIPTRVVSPYNGMSLGGGVGLGVFPSKKLQPYINKVFRKYARGSLIAQTTGPTAHFTGSTHGGSMVFTRALDGKTVTFAKPTSLMAYEGYLGTLSDPSDGNLVTESGELARFVQAGYMRTTMLKNGHISACPGKKAYYKNDPVNFYSRNVHKVAHDHMAYGFGWDDVCDQASDFTVFDPDYIQIKILPLKK